MGNYKHSLIYFLSSEDLIILVLRKKHKLKNDTLVLKKGLNLRHKMRLESIKLIWEY